MSLRWFDADYTRASLEDTQFFKTTTTHWARLIPEILVYLEMTGRPLRGLCLYDDKLMQGRKRWQLELKRHRRGRLVSNSASMGAVLPILPLFETMGVTFLNGTLEKFLNLPPCIFINFIHSPKLCCDHCKKFQKMCQKGIYSVSVICKKTNI